MRASSRRATAIAGIVLGGVLCACGGEQLPSPSGPGVSSLSPSELRKADCNDWNTSAPDERLGAVRGLTTYFGRNLPEGAPPQTLPDDQAYELLDGTCSKEPAGGVLLWGVYMQAAAFNGYGEAYETALRQLEETR